MVTGNSRITRRTLLGWIGLSGAAALVASCGGGATSPTAAPAAQAPAKSAPATEAPKPAAATPAPAATKPAAAATKPAATAAAGAAPKAAGATEIVWFNLTSAQNLVFFQEAIDEFQRRNPKIAVNIMHVPQNAEQKFMTLVAAGDIPDVAYCPVHLYRILGKQGVFQALNENVARDNVKIEDYRASSTRATTSAGKIYALPIGIYTSAFVYNVDLFEKAGIKPPPRDWNDKTWTWDKFVEVATAMTKRSGTGRVEQWGFVDDYSYGSLMAPIAAGGTWFDSRETATKSTANTPQVIAGLQWSQDLMYKHKVRPTIAESQTFGSGDTMFQTGKVALSSCHYKTISTIHAPIKNFKWAVAAAPTGPSGKPFSQVGHQSMGMSAKTPKKDESWQFLKWITWDKDGVEIQTKGAVMACVKHADPRKAYPLKDHMDDLQVMIDVADIGYEPWDADGVLPKMGTVRTEETQKLELNSQDAKTTAAAIEKRINDIFKEG